MPPTIYNCVAIEPEFEARLAAAGELRSFDARAGEAAIAEAVRGADALLLNPMVPVGEELLAGAPNLKVAATTSVGFNTFDVDLLTRHGVALCNTPIVLNDAVADLTMALMLMLSRGLMGFEQYSRSGGWAPQASRIRRWRTTRRARRSASSASGASAGRSRGGRRRSR